VSEEQKREESRPAEPEAARREDAAEARTGGPADARVENAGEEKRDEPAAEGGRETVTAREASGGGSAGTEAGQPAQPQPDAASDQPASAAGAEAEGKAAPAGDGDGARAGEGADAGTGKSGGEAADAGKAAVDPEREAKIRAAQEARAARLAAKAAAGAAAGGAAAGKDAAAAEPKPPSPKQPWLDEAVELLKTEVHPDAVEEATINALSDDMPTIVVKAEHWPAAAKLLRDHEKLGCRYLRNVTGVDYETHMEVVYFVINMETKREYAIKIRTDREHPSVPSAVPVWPGADWPEREIYDLLGIEFPGHPNLRRILMPDDWVGHPLRKDYVPLDPEV